MHKTLIDSTGKRDGQESRSEGAVEPPFLNYLRPQTELTYQKVKPCLGGVKSPKPSPGSPGPNTNISFCMYLCVPTYIYLGITLLTQATVIKLSSCLIDLSLCQKNVAAVSSFLPFHTS